MTLFTPSPAEPFCLLIAADAVPVAHRDPRRPKKTETAIDTVNITFSEIDESYESARAWQDLMHDGWSLIYGGSRGNVDDRIAKAMAEIEKYECDGD